MPDSQEYGPSLPYVGRGNIQSLLLTRTNLLNLAPRKRKMTEELGEDSGGRHGGPLRTQQRQPLDSGGIKLALNRLARILNYHYLLNH